MNIEIPRIPIGEWVEVALDWFRHTFDWLLGFFTVVLRSATESLVEALLAIPYPILILVFGVIGWLVHSWKLAATTVVTFLLIESMGFWQSSMQTLSLVLVATILAVCIAIPLGILAAKNDRFSSIIRPVLDFMQTMPGFVWLIPAVLLFSIGYVPGIFATILFSLPPGVRFTELGIRGVDAETVEAGEAFGATSGQILRGIQLPLAMPTIMAGINQVIMLALSMAVLAGFVGADGLGKDVVAAVSTMRLSLGIEAGLSIVIIAIFLDRVTSALGTPSDHPKSLLGIMRAQRKRKETP